jgi:hypothetical protein
VSHSTTQIVSLAQSAERTLAHVQKITMEAATAEQVNDAMLQLARVEGTVYVYRLVRSILTQEIPEGMTYADLQIRATHAVLALLAEGADDTWSGRRGDYTRSVFDGKCAAVREIMWSVLGRPS